MRALTHIVVMAIVAFAVGSSLFARSSNSWDTLLQDVYAYGVAGSRSSDAIYVAIDDRSIAEFGGWPWPRSTHAQLLARLDQASAVVYDIAFIGRSDSPRADAALETAAAATDGLILPLLAERNLDTGELVTLLPFGRLAEAALLGHIDMPIDNGSRLRTIYLKAGNANAQFPLLAYAADIVTAQNARVLKGARPNHLRRERGGIWTRDYANLLMPSVDWSTVSTVSASSVIRGEVAPSVFAGRPVFVGIDAETVTKKLSLAGFDARKYSDAQVQLVAYEAIRHGDLIVPVSNLWVFISTVIAVLLAGLLLLTQTSRLKTYLLCGCLVFVLLVMPLLLATQGLWVTQGYGLLAVLLLLVHYFVRRADFFHRRVIPVNEYPPTYWQARWAVQTDAAIAQKQAVAVAVIELDYFDRFKLDYSGGHISDSYYRVRSALQASLSERSTVLAFEHYQENRWVVLFGCADVERASVLVKALPAVAEAMDISHQSSSVASVLTVTVGAAVIGYDSGRDLMWLLGNADVALMQAIAQGRNHCVVLQ